MSQVHYGITAQRFCIGDAISTTDGRTLCATISREARRILRRRRALLRAIMFLIEEANRMGAVDVRVDYEEDWDQATIDCRSYRNGVGRDCTAHAWRRMPVTVVIPGLSAEEEVDLAMKLDERLGEMYPGLLKGPSSDRIDVYVEVESPGERPGETFISARRVVTHDASLEGRAWGT
ncbi:MAG: hypothetical protein RXR82_00430 [Nitrososphaeria archaeon]